MARWERILGYPEYIVSDDGNVRKLNSDGTFSEVEPYFDRFGYLVVLIKKQNGTPIELNLDRIVAETFTPTDNWSQLEKNNLKHRDGDLLNNAIENLEWVDEHDTCDDEARKLYLNAVGDRHRGRNPSPVVCENIETGERIYFESQKDAELYLGVKNISPVFSGKQKTVRGYRIFKISPR